MNILFLLRYWPIFGGGETVTLLLSKKFVELGYKVSILYLWEKGRDVFPFVDDRINQKCISDISKSDKLHGINKRDLKKLKYALKEFIQTNDIDIIINQWWPAKIVYKIKQGTNIKQINCHHTNIFQNIIVYSLKQRIFYGLFGSIGIRFRLWLSLYNSFRYSDRWVLLSKTFLDEAKILFTPKFVDKKVRIISNPLTYNYVLSKEDVKYKEKEILYVGRLDRNKRVTYIIDAWNKLEQKEELHDWRLIIVGEGIDFEKIKEYANEKKCQRIQFAGRQNPQQYYMRAAIFVMASANEGWPMVLTEAQQHGCVPIVMDSFKSLHEIVENGNNGIVVKNNDIDEFSAAIEEIMVNDEYRQRLACTGLETCMRFSIENIIQCWSVLFSEVCR